MREPCPQTPSLTARRTTVPNAREAGAGVCCRMTAGLGAPVPRGASDRSRGAWRQPPPGQLPPRAPDRSICSLPPACPASAEAPIWRHHHGPTARRSGADDPCSSSDAFRVVGECARSASLKEWGRVKEMVGSGEHFRVVGACVRAGVVGVAGVRAGRGPPRRGLALTPASGDADSSSGPDGQHGAGVWLGLGCRTVVLTI
jgi:hypothetical protein